MCQTFLASLSSEGGAFLVSKTFSIVISLVDKGKRVLILGWRDHRPNRSYVRFWGKNWRVLPFWLMEWDYSPPCALVVAQPTQCNRTTPRTASASRCYIYKRVSTRRRLCAAQAAENHWIMTSHSKPTHRVEGRTIPLDSSTSYAQPKQLEFTRIMTTHWNPTHRVEGKTILLDDFQLSFHRTLRVPDNHDITKLPPSLGRFPIYNAADYASNLPEEMARKGGCFLSMYREWFPTSIYHYQRSQ